ncbi:glutamate racemase [Saccharothrix sp. ST-888]|uniref:glutamate racemase n=1 Tax=Saccharothrix sp. ST-888 TaxID=1427391 RepID=UPI0005ED0822|nr:aspartate/glutamate racemase family protein [Saccharothrix sp. ST-888]KJK57531.1 glutamate racemase [Saccharothrix sp. ST-888]
MKIALMDSGIGLLPTAAALRQLRPDVDLVLSSDPDGMPWGPRTAADITEHALACARAAAAHRPDALVVACNTASVHALEALRAELEPGLPVIGTVPAIKPAAAGGGRVAIWATPATTGSPYQLRLIEEFGGAAAEITGIACPGLAEAIERGDDAAIDAAVADAASRTPAGTDTIVLGCTHYELVEERIRAAVGATGGAGPVYFGSAGAVAAQALRRIGDAAAARGTAGLTVLHSGRPSRLPAAAAHYAQGLALVTPVPAAG